KKTSFCICLIFVFCIKLSAQHYSLQSQYMFNALLINPAYAGTSNAIDITASHRQQWTGLPMSPVTSSISLHSPVSSGKVNMGFSFSDDRIGFTSNQNLNGVYAYKLKMGDASLSFGVQAGLEFSRANWDKLIRNDADDNLLLSTTPSTMNFTSGAGAYYNSKKIYGGLSLPYLLNTGVGGSMFSRPFLVYGGYNHFMSDSSVIKSSLLVRGVKGSPVQFDLNVVFSWKQKYGLGFSYRNKESLVALLEFNFKKQYRLGYSYDYGVGPLKKYNNGSHEITFRYLIFKKAVDEKPAEKPEEGK
ncbi:MAG: type IX secretion system membrane protein PorP/SprF, partial [Bacteroidota bacterium]